MTVKEIKKRYFEDSVSEEELERWSITDAELKKFDELEWIALCSNGLKSINGGYSEIKFSDCDIEDATEYLFGVLSFGVDDCGDGHSERDSFRVKFNRTDLTLHPDD